MNHWATTTYVIKLKGDDQILDVIGIISQVLGDDSLVEKLGLGAPFDQISVTYVSGADDPTNAPSEIPTSTSTTSSASPTSLTSTGTPMSAGELITPLPTEAAATTEVP